MLAFRLSDSFVELMSGFTELLKITEMVEGNVKREIVSILQRKYLGKKSQILILKCLA